MATKNKTITLKVRLFTNKLPKHVAKKGTAWSRGCVEVEANYRHGIRHVGGDDEDLFHSLDEIVPVLKKVARRAGIRIRNSDGTWAVAPRKK